MRANPRHRFRRLLPLCAALTLPAVQADDASAAAEPPSARPGLCPVYILPPERILDAWAAEDRAAAEGEILQPPAVIAEADRVELQRDGASRLEGDVWLQQGSDFLSTGALEFDEASGQVRTLAPARFGSRQLILDADSATYDTTIGQGEFTDVEFWLLGRPGRGAADRVARTGAMTLELEGMKYSTCPPDDEDWWLKASSMDMDQDDGRGVGRNVRIAFMGVPFFYTPWISFPIDDRRMTGFLFPEFGSSGRTGDWLRVPYYLNLAPNYDATITPYYMTKRGTMLDTQFRYLFGWGRGAIDADYLDKDEETDTERYNYRFVHDSRLPADWNASVRYQQVSDEEYFQDFSGSGSGSLVSHVLQTAVLSKNELEYGAALRVERYQTVDPTIPEASRPYEKWPELDYYYSPLAFGEWLWLDVGGESVNFQREDRVSGWRHHAATAFSADFGDPGLRLTPRFSWWQTEYALEQPDGTALDISRGVPVSSLDMLARFQRPLANGGSQTLEPRLFYLYAPYRDQTDIPRFDTRATTDTLPFLFRENRFTGPDRVGDNNRVSVSLGSALIGPDGRQWFSARVARGWYLDDRRVQLSATTPPDTRTASNYYGEVEYLPTENQSLRVDVSYAPEDDELEYSSVQYRYQTDYDTLLQLAYRQRRQIGSGSSAFPLEQVDIGFATPLGRRWRLFGRAVYSLEEERSQETLAGFEYETCCWVFRTFNRRYIYNRDGDFDQSLWFQLELKGLSSVGRRIDEFLEEHFYGYGETT